MTIFDAEKIKKMYERKYKEPEPPVRPELIDLETDIFGNYKGVDTPLNRQVSSYKHTTASCHMTKITHRNFLNILKTEERYSFSGNCNGAVISDESSVGLDLDIDRRIVSLGVRYRRKIHL